jgi:hypothetical protein
MKWRWQFQYILGEIFLFWLFGVRQIALVIYANMSKRQSSMTKASPLFLGGGGGRTSSMLRRLDLPLSFLRFRHHHTPLTNYYRENDFANRDFNTSEQ